MLSGRFFSEVLTRSEIRVNELSCDNNPWALILDYPSTSAQNLCQQLPSFIWSHYPDALRCSINVFTSFSDFRAQKSAATHKI